jgi:hypothetical protein
MKKLTIAAITATIIIAATGAQITNGFIEKLLSFSVKRLIVEQVFDDLWERSADDDMNETMYHAYRDAREITYQNLDIKEGDDEVYIQARTIVVARVKQYFLSDNNLRDTYLAIQPRFKQRFNELDDGEKVLLRKKLADIKKTFELMLDKENQKKYKSWLDSLVESSTREISQSWLKKNLSAEEIAKRIRAGGLSQNLDRYDLEQETFSIYPNEDIAKFAGRRWREGGDLLLRDYLEVIEMAIKGVE